MEEQIKLLRNIIKSRSLSGEEGDVADLIKKKMEELDYDRVTTDEFGNVLGLIGEGSPQLMLEAHMDTVEAGDEKNWELEPYSGDLRDGLVYGRGAVDMKGPLSSMIFGAANAKRRADEYAGSVAVACVVHEETMEGAAIEGLISKETKPDLVVLGEPSGLDLCIGHRGRAVVNLNVGGKSAHASMPHLGRNAVLDLIDVIDSLRNKELGSDRRLGRETMALVDISCSPGGGPVIPDRASAQLDFRIGRNTNEEEVINFVQESIEDLPKITGEAEIPEITLRCYTGKDLTYPFFFPAWYCYEENLIKKAKNAIDFIPDTNVRTWGFSTDGIYTAGKANIPTIGFGPGDETLAHQPNERISIEELELATKGYEKLLDRFQESV